MFFGSARFVNVHLCVSTSAAAPGSLRSSTHDRMSVVRDEWGPPIICPWHRSIEHLCVKMRCSVVRSARRAGNCGQLNEATSSSLVCAIRFVSLQDRATRELTSKSQMFGVTTNPLSQ